MSGVVDATPIYNREVLQSIFEDCDVNKSGQVRASNLIKCIATAVPSSEVYEQLRLEELNRALDPERDDAYLTVDEFLKRGERWMAGFGFQLDSDSSPAKKALENNRRRSLQRLPSWVEFENHDFQPNEELVSLREELRQAQDSNQRLKFEKNSLVSEMRILEEQGAHLESLNDRLSMDLQSTRSELRSYQRQKFDLDDENNEQTNPDNVFDCPSETDGMKNLDLELEQTRDELAMLREELANERVARSGLQSSIETYQRRLEKIHNELISKEKTIDNLKLDLDLTKQDVEAANETRAQLQTTIENLRTENQRKDDELQEIMLSQVARRIKFSSDTQDSVFDSAEGSNLSSTSLDWPLRLTRSAFISRPKRSRRRMTTIGEEIMNHAIKHNLSVSSIEPAVTVQDQETQTEHLETNKASGPSKGSNWIKKLMKVVALSLSLILCFTIFGGFELSGTTFVPVTWIPSLGPYQPVMAKYEEKCGIW